MKILFATDHIHYPQGGGGAEQNTHELCLQLRSQSIDCAVVCSLAPQTSLLYVTNRIRRATKPRNSFPKDMFCGYPVYRGWNNDISEVLSNFVPDIGVIQSTDPTTMLEIFAAHDIPATSYIHEVEKINHLTVHADKIKFFANSHFTAHRLRAVCGIEAKVIFPLIEPSHYQTKCRPRSVLFVNTVHRKGLEIAFQIAEARTDIHFDFVRSWILKPDQIKTLKARAEKSGNITIHKPTGNMKALYARTKVLLVPSLWEEAWGRVVTEAHINGIPVLASSQGGLPESVGPGGITISIDSSVEAWLAALSILYDNETEYLFFSNMARAHSERLDIKPKLIANELVRELMKIAPKFAKL